nr:MAG TPA: Ig-like domain protein [Caudoviricetes sp.]
MGNVINMIGGGENVNAEVATQKTDIEMLAKQIASVQLDFNSTYVWGKYTASGGDLLDYVYSTNSSAYPDGGTQGGYYYKIVRPVLTGISITTQPTKTTYAVGGSFDSTGMVVTATYDTGATKEVTGFTFSPQTFSSAGTKTVTISYTENGVTKTATLSVTVIAVGDFATSTWAEIKAAVQAGMGGLDLSEYWAVGDTKSVTLTTNEVIELQIAGFNHDTYSDGVTAPVTFVMKDCLGTTSVMNSSNNNTGGYPASAMKIWVEGHIYDRLPSDLKALVAPVKKKCYTTYNLASSLTEANYNVWLLAEAEVFDSVSYTVSNGEGTKYPIFTDDASRVKKVNGSANNWWLRSAGSRGSTGVVFVYSDGSVGNGIASNDRGVAVGLCIR